MPKLRFSLDASPHRCGYGRARSAALPSLLLALLLYAAPPPAAADTPTAVGQVAALSGEVVAQRPGEPAQPRPLGQEALDRGCGGRGVHVVTPKDTTAGVSGSACIRALATIYSRSKLKTLCPSSTSGSMREILSPKATSISFSPISWPKRTSEYP